MPVRIFASILTDLLKGCSQQARGNLAQRAGAGKKVQRDGPNMKVTNLPELNQWVQRPYRKGWKA